MLRRLLFRRNRPAEVDRVEQPLGELDPKEALDRARAKRDRVLADIAVFRRRQLQLVDFRCHELRCEARLEYESVVAAVKGGAR